jgi:hypothetical protein
LARLKNDRRIHSLRIKTNYLTRSASRTRRIKSRSEIGYTKYAATAHWTTAASVGRGNLDTLRGLIGDIFVKGCRAIRVRRRLLTLLHQSRCGCQTSHFFLCESHRPTIPD